MTIINQFDDDTNKILDISVKFLVQYFEYEESFAHKILKDFFHKNYDIFDEDFIHHESSYRVAATVHYFQTLGGEREQLGKWLIEKMHNNPPPEAVEYFRNNFFD